MFEALQHYQGQVDPQRGYLCLVTYWRPNPAQDTPDIPGEKLSTVAYISAAVADSCLCGSGLPFSACCQPRRFWHPICPNPGIPGDAGYSLAAPQKATFHNVDGTAVHAALSADERFWMTEDTAARSFWIYYGAPLVKTPYGFVCFGDMELLQARTLVVTAMSDLRMRVLLDVARELCGDTLGKPRRRYDPVYGIDKRSGKMVTRSARPAKKRR